MVPRRLGRSCDHELAQRAIGSISPRFLSDADARFIGGRGLELTVADLLTSVDLLAGFDYPAEFIRVVELGLTDLEPWWIFAGDQLRQRAIGLRERYPARQLVPFARRQDNDDVACWDLDDGNVTVIHDFAAPGWEQRGTFVDFNAWLRQAIEDLIEHGG